MRQLAFSFVLIACALSAQTKKILISNADPDILKELQSASPQAQVISVTPDTLTQQIADADAFIGEIKPEQVRAGKKLKWVQIMSAGVERVLHLSGGNDLRDSNIILTNNQIVQGPEIADHAMAMLLMLSRGLNIFVAHRQQEMWQGGPMDGIELQRAQCRGDRRRRHRNSRSPVRAWAFGMNVIGVDPEDIPYMPVRSSASSSRTSSMKCCPRPMWSSSPRRTRRKSHKMMGPQQFELMKKGSLLHRRQPRRHLRHGGLVKALDGKQLAGAGVDVTDPEPLPKGHPLWKFDNVVITPHIAGRSDKDRARMVGTIKENIRRFVDGQAADQRGRQTEGILTPIQSPKPTAPKGLTFNAAQFVYLLQPLTVLLPKERNVYVPTY